MNKDKPNKRKLVFYPMIMKLLIVAATELEITPSIPLLLEHQVDYLITGVGMVATAFALGSQLSKKSYDLLVNVGIAGSFSVAHQIGELYKIKTDQIFQFGAENKEEFISIEHLGFGHALFHELLPPQTLPSSFYEMPYSNAITVNTVHGNTQSIHKILETMDQDLLESMEGAAFFYASNTRKIPAIQIRAISNYVEERNVSLWNIPMAIINLNNWLQSFVLATQTKANF
ncbi:futalosine hydrolase [Sphingobacterium sp. HJSM2_6]|uniref:futalosine hydrolase n=1 Tax=Sphingobacterium sp. HJSM2_6 TaxID=3366264 RepID=UPI003BBC1D70